MQEQIYVLYHGDCTDGFGAAWAAWRRFGIRAEYIAVYYSEEFPIKISDIKTNAIIYIVDFSYPLKTLLEIQKATGCRFKLIDHHKSAIEDFNKDIETEYFDSYKSFFGRLVPKWLKAFWLKDPVSRGIFIDKLGLEPPIFDVNKSGAVLAWEHLHPARAIPDILAMVQDRDLWRFNILETEAFHEGLEYTGKRFSFTHWDMLFGNNEYLNEMISHGETIVKYNRSKIDKIVDSLSKWLRKEIDGHNVIIINAATLRDELSEAFYSNSLLNIDYVIIYYFMSDGKMKLSFRCKKDSSIDLTKIAKKYNGGGHRSSAGAVLDKTKAVSFLRMVYG